MLLDVSKNTFAQYALQGSGLNVACCLADELDTKLLTLLLVTKQTRFPDDLYDYKQNLYNWAHDVRNKLHSIPLYSLHLGSDSALHMFSSIYSECQGLRSEVCNDPVSSIFPDVKAAVQALALTSTPEPSEPRAAAQCPGGDMEKSWNRQQEEDGLTVGPTTSKEANQALLEAVEKVQQQTRLPSPSSSEITGCDIEPQFSTEPARPIPEPLTPPKLES